MFRGVALILAIVLLVCGRNPATAADLELQADRVYRGACDAYSSGLYSIAFRDLMPYAVRGDAWSQFAIAEMLRTGNGTRRDRAEALIWYKRAAEQDYAPAQCNLGTSLYFGWGAPADAQLAIDWWLRAALNRNGHALFNLGVVVARGKAVPRDFVRAYRLLMESEGLGYVRAADVLTTLRSVMSSDDVLKAERMGFYDALDFSRTPVSPPGASR